MTILKSEMSNLDILLGVRGNLPKADIVYISGGLESIAKVLGLSKNQAKRGFRAVQQMLAKEVVTPEDLRLQFIEAGFNQGLSCIVKASQELGLVDKSLGDLDATLTFFELQKQGKVVTKDILVTFIGIMREYYNLNRGTI